jgi:hypothetical protein
MKEGELGHGGLAIRKRGFSACAPALWLSGDSRTALVVAVRPRGIAELRADPR